MSSHETHIYCTCSCARRTIFESEPVISGTGFLHEAVPELSNISGRLNYCRNWTADCKKPTVALTYLD